MSDWVWREIHEARKKEKDEGRDVLCPIALDDSWEHPDKYDKSVQYAVKTHQVELGFLDRNHILDFSNSRKFNSQFDRLVRGLKINYNEPKQ